MYYYGNILRPGTLTYRKKSPVVFMENEKRTIQLELIYSAVILLLVAILLIASNLYSTDLWLVKTMIALALFIVSAILGKIYWSHR